MWNWTRRRFRAIISAFIWGQTPDSQSTIYGVGHPHVRYVKWISGFAVVGICVGGLGLEPCHHRRRDDISSSTSGTSRTRTAPRRQSFFPLLVVADHRHDHQRMVSGSPQAPRALRDRRRSSLPPDFWAALGAVGWCGAFSCCVLFFCVVGFFWLWFVCCLVGVSCFFGLLSFGFFVVVCLVSVVV